VARQLLQMRWPIFLVKPVSPVELVRTCARVVQAPSGSEQTEAQIFTLSGGGRGAGVTTLAIRPRCCCSAARCQRRVPPPACRSRLPARRCADYLDLEPRLDLKESSPAERLDASCSR